MARQWDRAQAVDPYFGRFSCNFSIPAKVNLCLPIYFTDFGTIVPLEVLIVSIEVLLERSNCPPKGLHQGFKIVVLTIDY